MMGDSKREPRSLRKSIMSKISLLEIKVLIIVFTVISLEDRNETIAFYPMSKTDASNLKIPEGRLNMMRLLSTFCTICDP